MNSIKRNAQAGFTMIELIVVIIILGILAATAIPKFASMSADARIATINSAKGAMAATSAMAHSKYLIDPSQTSTSMEGTSVTFVNGYPKADAAFVTAAGLDQGGFSTIAAGSAATANSPATTATEIAILAPGVAGRPAGLTCYVKYAQASSATTAPTMSVTTTGCD